MDFIAKALAFVQANESALGIGVALLFGVSKMVSTEKAVPVVSQVQALFDGAAKLLQVGADLLANALKSDGFFGKK